MKSGAGTWRIAADMIAQYGPRAEREAAGVANRMLDLGDRKRQIEWLRVRTAIVLIQAHPAPVARTVSGWDAG